MASLLQSERVLYLVRGEKEMRAPLSQLYFCRYCSELRSLECVSHEVTAARPLRAGIRNGALPSARAYWLPCLSFIRDSPRHWLAAPAGGGHSGARA